MPSDVHSSHKRPASLVVLSGGLISHVHTVMGFIAFFGALITALSLHYQKVVKNHVAQYPDEWWPSVSATIGDWYPERNIFQVGIALMAGPRFILVFLSALLVSLSTPSRSAKASILLFVGVLRTLACGGWVYVTSTDDHLFHDIAMFVYLALTPPWMFITSGSLAQPSPDSRAAASEDKLASKARRMRRIACFSFFACTPFMGFFFYRHNALRIPGAYSYYAYFEWGLIIFVSLTVSVWLASRCYMLLTLDLLFDAASVYDLSRFEIHVVEAPPAAKSPNPTDQSAAYGPEGRRLIDGAWVRGGRSQAIAAGAWSASQGNIHTDGQPATSDKEIAEDDEYAVAALNASIYASTSPTSLRAIISLVSDSYLAFCFWTALTALHPMIFYFSVYNLAIGGHEVLLVSQVIGLGLTLAIPSLRSSVRRKTANGICIVGPVSSQAKALGWLLSLVGQASWYVADPLVRLISVAFSNALLAVLLALEWGAAWEADQLPVKLGIWLVGLLASNLAKYANHSNNPAWPFMDSTNGGHNILLLSLALVAVAETALRPKYDGLPIVQRRRAGGAAGVGADSQGSFWAAALGVGALLYSVHTFLTDTGTMIAWGWTGYPIKGPMAIPHGCIILITMSFSSLAATRWSTFGYRLSLFLVQCGSAALIYFTADWSSFIGAIGMALSLPPLAFPIVSAAMRHDPIKVMLFGWLVANVLTFLGVLTVAYAFVPGGKIMRERVGFMLVVQLALLGLGLFNARTVDLKRLESKQGEHASASKTATDGKTAKASASSKAARSGSTYYICLLMALIGLVGNVVPLYRIVPATSITPHHPEDRLVTAGMWTVHFALDQHMRDSSRRMASIMKTLDMDLFGLVESDLHRPVFGNRDLTQFLAEELKMYTDIGPAPSKNTWGAALFSKFPIINSTHHLLPSPGGELAPAIHAVIDLYGTPTHVIVSHNGQEEDPLDRELQTTEIARIFREVYPHPAIFLGYVVTKPHADRPAPYKILFEDGKIQDVEPTDSGRWCEYLGFRGLERVSYVRVSRYTVTDTELQTMKLVVPKEPINPDTNELTRLVIAETYPESMRYPTSLIDLESFVYDKHLYSPYPWPIYYAREMPDF
ncbi:related to CWH43 - putative sensor/transporter protein [Ustilago trichophora]|uniref:Related to CWH43 - putative sensor/transporter protein n=1 Tax=Ustilago trichophora TaxID=86804 RepID=A0A5C3E171_9BASI|nr:related to CWH43 - putative sensor/transporter protein [Ustilago trichophora]